LYLTSTIVPEDIAAETGFEEPEVEEILTTTNWYVLKLIFFVKHGSNDLVCFKGTSLFPI
jgi:hypothetical protein